MRRHRADLPAGVEDPRRADAIDPRAVGLERRLVHVAGEDDVGLVLVDPASEIGVAVVAPARPAGWRPQRRPVVDPHPSPRASCGIGGELRLDQCAPGGTVPPGADGDQRVVDEDRAPVRGDAFPARFREPERGTFVVVVGPGEIVVPRADCDHRRLLDEREVAQHHHDLRVERHARADVEVVAGQHHQVEVGGGLDDPIELPQRVVKVGHEEYAQGGRRSKKELSEPTTRPLGRCSA